MPKPDKNKKNLHLADLAIGDRILVNLYHRRAEKAIVKAIIPHGDGRKFPIDFGHDETALMEDWQTIQRI